MSFQSGHTSGGAVQTGVTSRSPAASFAWAFASQYSEERALGSCDMMLCGCCMLEACCLATEVGTGVLLGVAPACSKVIY